MITRGRFGSVIRYFGEVIAELKKAVWPSRQDTRRLTIMVIAISVAIGALLGSLDLGFTRLVDLFFRA